MLATIFSAVLTLSLSGSVVALAILLLRAFFWRRLPASFIYALWALLIFRLLLPVAPPSPVSLFSFPHQSAVQNMPLPKPSGTPIVQPSDLHNASASPQKITPAPTVPVQTGTEKTKNKPAPVK